MKRITALILLIVLVVTAIPVYADEQVVNGYIKDTETGEITGLSHDTLAKGSPDASSNKISIAFFGDSIMAGRDGRYLVTPREGASPGSYMTLVSESEQIPGVIESMLPDNYECFNYGLGGTGYINQGTSYSALSNIKGRDLSNMDYVVICYGSNDYSPIFYKMDKTTQCSQEVIKKNLAIYRAQIEACLDAISGPEIILVAPWRHIGNGLENWALKSIDPMVKEIAEARGITYISQSSCPLQSGAFSDGTDSDVMGATSLYNNKPQYHPSSDGYAILGEWLFEQIEDIVVPPAPEITLNGLNDNGFIKSSSELSLSINAPSFDKAVITINGETTEIQETSYQFNFGEAENTETGTYEIEVTAYNKVGAYATENYIVKLDNYSPRATITGVTKEFYSEDVSVGKSVEEANIDSISFTMNNEETEGKKVTEEGNYSIYLEVTDKAGNASTDEKSFVIDKTNPVVAISGDYNGFAKALSDITVNTEDSNIDNVIIKIKKGEEIVKTLNGGESITLEDIEGEESDNTSYTLNIEATDKAGNKTTLSKDIHIDNKLPDISFNINKEYYNEPVTIEVTTGEENVESITVSVTKDGENIGDVRNLTEDGSYTVKAVITDIVGNTYEREVSFVIDTRIPTVSLAGDKNGFVKSLDEVSIEAKDDNLNTTMTKVYLGEELVKTFHGTPTTLEGIETPENDTTVYVIKVTALDKAGNETKEEYKITVDNKDPDIKFNVNDKAFLNKAVSIEVTTSEENVEEIILTGTFNGEKITDLSNLEADGEYTAKATIIDKIGNSTKKEISFTIDTTKPEVNLEGLNENGYVKSLDELTVIASDTNYDGMTVDVTKEESLKVYETNEIELNIETLDDRNVDSEEYTVSVTAKDKAGNIAQKDFKVMRDNSAPRIKFDGTEEDAI
ncbi:MAG: SGNH/GDSL hydrolase family protein, partial [Lachnospiraceae bacterium]|nr:SGNH/GDSL hydrolase family protein [Lachnospiraceae bacterium]